MPCSHLILCCPLLLLPSIFPSIRVFFNELALRIRWPKYWSFSNINILFLKAINKRKTYSELKLGGNLSPVKILAGSPPHTHTHIVTYIYLSVFIVFSTVVYHRILSVVPCAVYTFIYSSLHLLIPDSQSSALQQPQVCSSCFCFVAKFTVLF